MGHITTAGTDIPAPKKRWYRQLYFWVLTGIVLGILVGWLAPATGIAMEPIGTTFVTAMKMLIGPIVFLTIVGGIASVADLKKVGVTGLKALTYFQVGTILAMIFGLVAINVFRVGDGVNADPGKIEASESAQKLITSGETKQWWEFITHLVPDSMVSPFVEGRQPRTSRRRPGPGSVCARRTSSSPSTRPFTFTSRTIAPPGSESTSPGRAPPWTPEGSVGSASAAGVRAAGGASYARGVWGEICMRGVWVRIGRPGRRRMGSGPHMAGVVPLSSPRRPRACGASRRPAAPRSRRRARP